VAYILPDEYLLTKAETRDLTYTELAALKQRALAGDASAEIALACLPKPDQRLAEMLVKEFSGKAGKPKKAKKSKGNAASRQELTTVMQMFAADLAHPDPVIREAASEAMTRA
jgi:hypothetical protein